MSYYPTIEEDLQRAKDILAKKTIAGADDSYAAYKLLERFVAEVERLQQEVRSAIDNYQALRDSATVKLETLQQQFESQHIACGEELQQFYRLFSDYEEPCHSFAQAQALWNEMKAREARLRAAYADLHDKVKDIYAEGLQIGMDLGKKLDR
jgi:uncharacterized protein (UPF0335 family)